MTAAQWQEVLCRVRSLTWAEVADLLGDYYTEEGVCRMAYNYLAKTEKEKPSAQSA